MKTIIESVNELFTKKGFILNNIFLSLHRDLFPPDENVRNIFQNSPRGLIEKDRYIIYKQKSRGLIIEPDSSKDEIKKYMEESQDEMELFLYILEKDYFIENANRVINQIKQTESPEAIYGLILSKICEIVNADKGVVTQYISENNRVYGVGPGYNVSRNDVEHFAFKMREKSAAYRAFKTRRIYSTNDALNDPNYIKEFVKYYNVERACTIPLFIDDKLSGFIYITRGKNSSPFEKYELDMLEYISYHIASLLKFLDIYEKSQKRLNVLSRLEKASRVILSEMNVKKVMELIVRFSVNIFEVDASSLMVYEPDKEGLLIKASYGLSDEYVKNQFIPYSRVKKKLEGYGKNRDVKVYYIRDMKEEFFGNPELIKNEGLVSALSQPILIEDSPFALLNIYTKEERVFDQTEIDLMIPFGLQVAIAIKNSELYNNSINTTKGLINALATLESKRDFYTAEHSNDVADIATSIGKKYSLDKKSLEELYIAGLLHDLGKIAIEKSVLLKSDPLSREEMKEMKKHPEVGKSIIEKIPNMDKVATCVHYHHERWDGKGYPEGLKGNDIPICSRILCLADSISAMMSDRPYRNALTDSEIKKELMNEKGKQFDPKLVEIFLDILNQNQK